VIVSNPVISHHLSPLPAGFPHAVGTLSPPSAFAFLRVIRGSRKKAESRKWKADITTARVHASLISIFKFPLSTLPLNMRGLCALSLIRVISRV
jgi:hypothetical protein